MSDNQLAQLTTAIQAMDKGFEDRFQAMDEKFESRFQAMDSRFNIINNKFDAMEKKFDTQFTKLFKHTQKEFGSIHKKLDQTATKAELNTYVNAVDAFAKQTETYHQEMLVLGRIVDRHKKWHRQTAKAAGLKLSA